jgi:hypothetical protein
MELDFKRVDTEVCGKNFTLVCTDKMPLLIHTNNKSDLKVCDDGTLLQVLRVWTLSIFLSLTKNSSCLFSKTQRFADWILSPSSRKTYSVGSNRQS